MSVGGWREGGGRWVGKETTVVRILGCAPWTAEIVAWLPIQRYYKYDLRPNGQRTNTLSPADQTSAVPPTIQGPSDWAFIIYWGR
ncbi:hypothetical protein LINPERHAP1_LOCUS20630 [Linum perenne]